MTLIIKISSSKFDNNIFINKNLSRFNQLISHIIKDNTYSNTNIHFYLHFYLHKNCIFYIIKFNNTIYNGMIESNYITFNIKINKS
jgi:hypothetical protein